MDQSQNQHQGQDQNQGRDPQRAVDPDAALSSPEQGAKANEPKNLGVNDAKDQGRQGFSLKNPTSAASNQNEDDEETTLNKSAVQEGPKPEKKDKPKLRSA